MMIKRIPFSRLEAELEKILNECVESGETIIVEMPGQRLLAIQSVDHDDDGLIDGLLASDTKFCELVAKSKATPRKAFTPGKPC